MTIGMHICIAGLLFMVAAAVSLFVATSGAADVNNTVNNATKNVTINLTAEGFAFDRDAIEVPAGANVTVNFDNQDSGVPHNLAVYETSAADTTIFKGEIINGPRTITYSFTAPTEPGTYFFRCDVHPNMNGDFIVT